MLLLNVNENKLETVSYNNPNIPIYIGKNKLSEYPNYRAIPHWHDDIEIIAVLKGQMDYNVNGNIITLTKGNGIFVNSKALHYGFSDTNTECEFVVVVINPYLIINNEYILNNYLNPYLLDQALPYHYLNMSVDYDKDILNYTTNIELNSRNGLDVLYTAEALLHIMRLLIENKDKHVIRKVNKDVKILMDMVSFVEANYKNKISILDLCEHASISKTKCSQIFKDLLKTSPALYINSYRLSQGVNLLNTDMSITEIAYEVGFSNSSYFCEAFKKEYNMTPNEFRKKYL